MSHKDLNHMPMGKLIAFMLETGSQVALDAYNRRQEGPALGDIADLFSQDGAPIRTHEIPGEDAVRLDKVGPISRYPASKFRGRIPRPVPAENGFGALVWAYDVKTFLFGTFDTLTELIDSFMQHGPDDYNYYGPDDYNYFGIPHP